MNRKATSKSLAFGLNTFKKAIKPTQIDVTEDAADEAPQTSITLTKQKKTQVAALAQDDTIFDYDAAWSQDKQVQALRKSQRDGVIGPDGKKQPKYMENLITIAKTRKANLEKSREKRLKERDVDDDTQEFVTESYLAMKKEAEALEEAEKIEEAKEMDPLRERDVVGFYRGILEKVSGVSTVPSDILTSVSGADVEADHGENLIVGAVKSNVKVNESNEVIDKRELLSGGLNLTTKAVKRKQVEEQARETERVADLDRRDQERKRIKTQQEQQKRNRVFVKKQREEVETERRRKDVEGQEAAKAALVSKVSVNNISDAKARYLARKEAESQLAKQS